MTDAAFLALYHDFTGADSAPPGTPMPIGRILAQAEVGRMQLAAPPGALVLVTSTGIFVYDAARRLLAQADYRDAQLAGFFESTSLSHVGPAISYLARIRELGDDRWRPAAGRLLAHTRDVAALNARVDWLADLGARSWDAHREPIRDMFAYGCAQAVDCLERALANEAAFTVAAVERDFLSAQTDRFPIPFNLVMIGTFALAALEGAWSTWDRLRTAAVDWAQARVVVRALAGTNYTAGLTLGTNWLTAFLRAVSADTLPPERIVIAPYAELQGSVGSDPLDERTFAYYAEMVWGQAFYRERMARALYPSIPAIYLPDRPPLPGDYEVSSAGDIAAFLMRLKHSFGDRREMLSNTIAFWMAGELRARGWDPARVALPGLNAGFPPGIAGYPRAT